MATVLRPGLERRLTSEIDGEVLFDRFSRGRYATDASHYQMMPLGVVVPKTMEGALRAMALAREEGVPVTPRGGGTSQCGQTINRGLVIDNSKYLRRLLSLDVENRRCVVEPGIVLDDLNRQLKKHGLYFPVDVSTASRATIGGMAGNNSCGGRSLRYGTMRDNVVAIDAVLADGTAMHFGETSADLSELNDPARRDLAAKLLGIGAREADAVARNFPKVQRRVGGYNIDALNPAPGRVNLAHILVGSEGTLAYSTAIELKLWPLLGRRGVGVCHFGSFHAAMDAAQHLVKLKPIAIELVDATMIGLARDIPMFRPTLEAFVQGDPAALLLVEFAEDEAENARRLEQLSDLMGDLGFGFDRQGAQWGGVVKVLDPALQAAITDLRTSGLNIMMSMKEQRKPISFVEDCAVPLPHLAEYTAKLTEVFEKHGTKGTWYAHASEGCLHVRPVLNLRLEKDVAAMRAIAEEAFELVRAYKGSHSGEHGDGLVRSEFHEKMFGTGLVRAFEEVKQAFDPAAALNPGKIVHPSRFDDRTLFRYKPDYAVADFKPALDWSEYPGAVGGLQGAVEMCNNNGACRKLEGGAMCPSYRATRDEQHLTRGRANSLRLALSGQLGEDAFASDAMAETMKLCVSCKACKRECPTGVDMARMKIEVLAARAARRGFSLRDRLVAHLPRYAPYAAHLAPLLNLRNRLPVLAKLAERWLGFSARRSLPVWRRDRFTPPAGAQGRADGPEVVLWADTFNAAFEPENIHARHRHPHRRGLSGACRARAGRRAPALLRPHLSLGRRCRRRQGGNDPHAGGFAAIRHERHSDSRAGAELPVFLPRRSARSAARRGRAGAGGANHAGRGIHRSGDQGRPLRAAPGPGGGARGAARPLPPEGVRRDERGADRARPDPWPEGGDHRVQLLRHGRRVRLSGGNHRHVAAHGRTQPAAGGARGGAGDAGGGRWHVLPAPDP